MQAKRRARSVWIALVAVGVLCVAPAACGMLISSGFLASSMLRPAAESVQIDAPAAGVTPSDFDAPLSALPEPTAVATRALPSDAATTRVEHGAPAAGTASIRRIEDPTATPDAGIGDSEKAFQRGLWEKIWTTVNDNYAYADFHGFDWAGERERMRARIDGGMSRDTFYETVLRVTIQLGDEHSDFFDPKYNALVSGGEGKPVFVGTGIIAGINARERRLYVRKVLAGSPAAAAGILPHMHILSVNGRAAVDDTGVQVRSWLNYRNDAETVLIVRTPGETQTREVRLRQTRFARGEEPMVSRLLSPDQTGGRKIGYLFVPTMASSWASANFGAELESLMSAAGGSLDGLILDLRINPGGDERVLQRMLGALSGPGEIGRNIDRAGTSQTLNLDAENSRALGNSQQMKIAVLIGPDTNSASEILAAVLRRRHPGRVVLVGARSMGNVERVDPFEFDDGSTLWLATAVFHWPDGQTWEGVGLAPDVPVAAGWDAFADGQPDPVIDAAARALASQ